MSESLDGVSFSVTRQNAGSVLNGAVAFALAAFGGANAPACTESADSTRPFVTFVCASDSHAIGAGAAAFNRSSVAAPSTAITAAILMRGSVDPKTPSRVPRGRSRCRSWCGNRGIDGARVYSTDGDV